MLIPIGDDDRRLHGPAYVTSFLLLANVLVYVVFQVGSGGDGFTYAWSAIPYELTTGIDLVGPQEIWFDGKRAVIEHQPGPFVIRLTVLSAMFMHGSLSHLLGNLLYLWIFGDNVEHRFGHRLFLLFYLVSGIAATGVQVALDPASIVPTLGASGAISGVLGAYIVLFPRNRVHALFFLWIVSIPAVVAIGAWIILQLLEGWSTLLGPGAGGGGVAYGAHIGGFAAGILLALIVRVFVREERPTIFREIDGRSGR